MSHYQQSLVLAASPEGVYAALTTAKGLAGWCTQDCDVVTRLGDTTDCGTPYELAPAGAS